MRRAESCSSNRPWHGIPLAIVLAFVFASFSVLRLIGDSHSIIYSQTALQSVLVGSILETKLARNIALFILAHVFLAILFGLVCWAIALISELAWQSKTLKRSTWILLWSVLAWALVLVANAAMYPWSLLGEPYAALATHKVFGVSVFQLTTTVILGFACLTIGKALWQAPLWRKKVAGALLPIAVVGFALLRAPFGESQPRNANGQAKPNVIIIGIDALRHDVPFGGLGQELTPAIDDFLRSSVRFTDAITPLARTFPSWVATLTGRHPHTTGAVMNLLPPRLICTGETLPQALRKKGYTTVYAIDEVRFSNIDASYGFDVTVTPPIGASDFLLGSLNDTPLSNLVVNTFLGKLLFPFSYANRASAVTYKPATFVDRLRSELPRKQPIFLAVHLTLAHWPYYWSDSPKHQLRETAALRELYAMSVREVDRQFASVASLGLLNNAIVVLMSDHGESLGMPNDNPYGEDNPELRGAIVLGHGTSVLSPQQYRVVLGMRPFGHSFDSKYWQPRAIDVPVTLTDVAPTLLDLLNIPSDDPSDGRSLVGLLANDPTASESFDERMRFTESEFNPRGFQPGAMLTLSALAAIMTFYELDPETDRVLVKQERLPAVLNDRQYAVLRGNDIVAALPTEEKTGFRYVWANREGRESRRIDPALEDNEAIRPMIEALQQRLRNVLAGMPVTGNERRCAAKRQVRRAATSNPSS